MADVLGCTLQLDEQEGPRIVLLHGLQLVPAFPHLSCCLISLFVTFSAAFDPLPLVFLCLFGNADLNNAALRCHIVFQAVVLNHGLHAMVHKPTIL